MKGAGQVRVERLAPAGQRDAGGRPHLAKRAGIIKGDVQPAVGLDGQRDQGLGAGLVPDVAGFGDRGAALGGDLGDQPLQRLPPPRRHDDLGPFAREQQCRRPAECPNSPR